MGIANWKVLALVGLMGSATVLGAAACPTQLVNLAVGLSPHGQFSVAVTREGTFVQLADTATRQGRAWNPLARLNPLITAATRRSVTSLSVLDHSHAPYVGSAQLAYTDKSGALYLGSTYSPDVVEIGRPGGEDVDRVVFARDPNRLYAFTRSAVYLAPVQQDRQLGPWEKQHAFSSSWLDENGPLDFHTLADDGTQVVGNERGKILILRSGQPVRELQYPVWMVALASFSNGDGLVVVGAGPDGRFRISRGAGPFAEAPWHLPPGVTAVAMAGAAAPGSSEFREDWHEGYLGRRVMRNGVAWRERILILASDGLVYSPWEEGSEYRGEMPSLYWHAPHVRSATSIESFAREGAGYDDDRLATERERLLRDRSFFEKLAAIKFWSARHAAIDAFHADPQLASRLALPNADTQLLLLDLLSTSVRRQYLESAVWDEQTEAGRELAQMQIFLRQPTSEARPQAQAPLERLAFAMGRSYTALQADFDQLLDREPGLANAPMFTTLNRLLAMTDPLWTLAHAQPGP